MQFTAPLASLLALAAFAQAGLVVRQDASASESASVSEPAVGGSATGSAAVPTGSGSAAVPTGGAGGSATRSTTSPQASSTGLEKTPGDGAGVIGAPGLAALAGAAVVAVVFA